MNDLETGVGLGFSAAYFPMTLSGPRPRLLWLALLALSASLASCSSDDPDPVDAAADAQVPGEDADGELYVVSIGGTIYKVEPA